MTEVTEHIHINIILPQETRQNTNKQPDLTPIEQLEKEQTKPKVSSVQFSCSVMSDSLQSHGLQHARLSCPLPTPGVYSVLFIESVIPSNHFILCHPLLLLPSIFPSIRVFFNEWAFHMRCPRYWSFSFSISPSNEYSGFISFRIDWFDLLAV